VHWRWNSAEIGAVGKKRIHWQWTGATGSAKLGHARCRWWELIGCYHRRRRMRRESTARAWNGAAPGWCPLVWMTRFGRRNCFLTKCLLAILLEKCYFSAGVIVFASCSKCLFFYFSGVCQKTLAEILLKCDK
jgi:hypothetical protein